MKLRKFVIFAISFALFSASIPAPTASASEMRDITTTELVHDMGIGINLGNTFEACGDWIAEFSKGEPTDYETAWGSPVITKQIIEGMAKEGFGVLRIPVAWSNMMPQDGSYTISPAYAERVREVVDWTIGSGMYAIINIHWDGGWVNDFPKNKDESMKRYRRMWTQIAEHFQDYSDYLIFESQNEELGWDTVWNPWGSTEGKSEAYALCNEINQAFVDVIRNSCGNNPQRHLLISGYNTGIDRTCDPLFKMPDDPANRMAVSVHYYSPAGFAILEEDADWGKAVPTWGSDEDLASLRNEMQMMKTHFTDQGIPVIIGEYGCPTKNKEPESVRRFLSTVCAEAYKYGHCPVMWATPGGHYDRDACQLTDRALQQALYAVAGKPYQPRQTIVRGDINGDRTLTAADAVALQQYLLHALELPASSPADLNDDGAVNAADLSILKSMLLAA